MKPKIRSVDPALTEEQKDFVRKNVSISYRIARRNAGLLPFSNGLSPDVKQISYLALCYAVRRYDKTHPFVPYLALWVKNLMRRYEGNDTRFHASWKHLDFCRRIDVTSRRLSTRRGDNKKIEYINWVIDRYNLSYCWNLYTSKRIDFEEIVDNKEEDVCVDFDLLKDLPFRERFVIEQRFGFYEEEKTLEEISKTLNISRERVRQIQNKAIEKIKERIPDERQFFDTID